MNLPEDDNEDHTLADLEVSLRCAISRIELASGALELQAPGLARKQIIDNIQAAEGFLMQAGDLAIQHVRSLEALLAEGKG